MWVGLLECDFKCLIRRIFWIHHEVKMWTFTPSRITNLGDLLVFDYTITDVHTRRTIFQMFVFRDFTILVQDFDIVSELLEGLFEPSNFGVIFDVDDNTDRKSTRLNSSHSSISYAVFCLKKK